MPEPKVYCLHEYLTNYVEQSPSWEANNHSTSRDIPHSYGSLQVMKSLIMLSSPVSCHILILISNHSPQNPFSNTFIYAPPLRVRDQFHSHTNQQVKF